MSERPAGGVEGPIEYEVRDRVARITLNRPERGNGITRGLLESLASSVERADLDPAVHVMLLSGNGPASAAAMTWWRARRGWALSERRGEGRPRGRRWTRR